MNKSKGSRKISKEEDEESCLSKMVKMLRQKQSEKNSNQRPKLGLRKSRVLNLPQKGAQKSKQNLHTQNNITEEDLKHAVIPPLK
jgi:hypothetical protein